MKGRKPGSSRSFYGKCGNDPVRVVSFDEFRYGYMLSEIFGELRGMPATERMANRVVAPRAI
jgi:hypothetical protein